MKLTIEIFSTIHQFPDWINPNFTSNNEILSSKQQKCFVLYNFTSNKAIQSNKIDLIILQNFLTTRSKPSCLRLLVTTRPPFTTWRRSTQKLLTIKMLTHCSLQKILTHRSLQKVPSHSFNNFPISLLKVGWMTAPKKEGKSQKCYFHL